MPEKKGLHPAIACAVMVVMLCCALVYGANRGWTRERASLLEAHEDLQKSIQLRIETAYNLLTVAGRYVNESDALYAAVQKDLYSMEDGRDRLYMVSAAQFGADGKALLSALSARSDVQADSRDYMYVTQMLPQALEQCVSDKTADAYNAAARAYNKHMNSWSTWPSGWLAMLTGVEPAAIYNPAEN